MIQRVDLLAQGFKSLMAIGDNWAGHNHTVVAARGERVKPPGSK